MIQKNTIRLLLGLLILSLIGCEEAPDENLTKPNDTILATTVVDVKTSKKPVVPVSITEINETLRTHRDISTAPEVASKSEDIRTDAYVLNSAEITGDILTVNVSYSGGCEPHEFTLNGQGSSQGSLPFHIDLFVVHNANFDLCDDWITEDNLFDLTPIKTLYQQIIQEQAGRINLHLKSPDNETIDLVYEFSR